MKELNSRIRKYKKLTISRKINVKNGRKLYARIKSLEKVIKELREKNNLLISSKYLPYPCVKCAKLSKQLDSW